MNKIKCIICGKEIKSKEIKSKEDLICDSCKKKKEDILEIKDPNITLCPWCLSIKYKNIWYKQNTKYKKDRKEILKKAMQDSLRENKQKINPKDIKIIDVDFDEYLKYIILNIKYKNKEYDYEFRIKKELCDICKVKDKQYFQSIIQLRNYSNEILEKIREMIKTKANKGLFINKEKNVKNGVDWYLTKKNLVHSLVKEIKNSIGGLIKISPKLHTRDNQTMKEIYRTTYLIDFLNLHKNDVFYFNNSIYIITKINKYINFDNLIKKESIKITFKEFSELKSEKIKKYKAKVLNLNPLDIFIEDKLETKEINNINNKKYMEEYLKKHNCKLEEDQNINIVEFNNEILFTDTDVEVDYNINDSNNIKKNIKKKIKKHKNIKKDFNKKNKTTKRRNKKKRKKK